MVTTVFQNSDLHFEHKQWEGELRFWEDELKTFNHRLEELIGRFQNQSSLVKLEHYQNEFILHQGHIEKLREEIEKHESALAGQSKTDDFESISLALMKGHLAFREKMETQRRIYSDLKKEFFGFLTDHM
jgi:hypothetical protein